MNLRKNVLFLVICFVLCIISCDGIDENYIEAFGSYSWRTPPKYDDNGATKSLNVAAVSLDVNLSPDVNREKMVALINKIKAEKPDVRLILFSETTLGYYYRPSNPFEYQKSIAETIPGETTNLISQKAKEHQLYISFGMAEKSGDDLYNSQIMIDPSGTILSIQHKNYLNIWDEEGGFKAGNDLILNVIDNIKVATIICRDYTILEMNKKAHNLGAELVLLPLASVTSSISNLRPLHHYVYSWVLSANRFGNEDGEEYDGMLYLNTPSGETKIKSAGKEGYICGVVKCR